MPKQGIKEPFIYQPPKNSKHHELMSKPMILTSLIHYIPLVKKKIIREWIHVVAYKNAYLNMIELKVTPRCKAEVKIKKTRIFRYNSNDNDLTDG
jgi:hypothetical protein